MIDHPDIVEAAVVARIDELKGEVPVGFVVLYPESNPDPKELEAFLVKKIRKEIGPIACLKKVMIL